MKHIQGDFQSAVLDSSELAPLSWDALSDLVSKWKPLALLLRNMDITVPMYLHNLSTPSDSRQGKYDRLCRVRNGFG